MIIKEDKLRTTATELNTVLGLKPGLHENMDAPSLAEAIRKVLRLKLIAPGDVFTPDTQTIIGELEALPDDELPAIEKEGEEEEVDLIKIVQNPIVKLKDLKDVVIKYPEFKELRPLLDEPAFANVEVLRDEMNTILTKLRIEDMPEEQPDIKTAEDKEPVSEEVKEKEPILELDSETEVPEKKLDDIGNRELKINPLFEKACPPLTADEFKGLEDLILADGEIIQPILIWDGTIIDGHNRYAIAKKHNIGFETEEIGFESETEALLWIKENAINQRNLTPFAKFEMMKEVIEILEKEGKKKQVTRYKNRAKEEEAGHDTAKEIASKTGMSRTQVFKAKDLEENADEETKEKLRTGETTISAEHSKLKEKKAPKEKKEKPVNEKKQLVKAEKELRKWIDKYRSNSLMKDYVNTISDIAQRMVEDN